MTVHDLAAVRAPETRNNLLVSTDNDRSDRLDQNDEGDQTLVDRADTLAAIRQGIREFTRGEGIRLEEAEDRLRRKHGFSH
jgi:hypothetical protein